MKSRLSDVRSFEVFFSLFLLIALAWWFRGVPSSPQVSVSGLALGMEPNQVQEVLGPPQFRHGCPNPWIYEYWNTDLVGRPLTVEFDSSGRVWRLEGGTVEIEGRPLSTTTQRDLTAHLGPPLRTPGLSHTTYGFHNDGRLSVRDPDGANPATIVYQAGGR